jgi:hypothetical protein
MNADPTAKYLAAYPPELRAQVRGLIAEGQLARNLEQRYPYRHVIANDGALYDYVNGLKSRCMRSAGPLSKAVYDSRLRLTQQALGTHTVVSRLQGGSLKAKREIHIASLFREAPTAFLRMIVVYDWRISRSATTTRRSTRSACAWSRATANSSSMSACGSRRWRQGCCGLVRRVGGDFDG